MSLKRRNARINDCSPPIDLDNPPSTCADLTIWEWIACLWCGRRAGDGSLYLINMDPDQLALARRCNGHMVNAVGTDGDDVLACLALKALLQGKKPLQVTPGAAIPNSMCDEVISTGWIS